LWDGTCTLMSHRYRVAPYNTIQTWGGDMRSNEIVRSKAVFKIGLLCFLVGVLVTLALAQERTGEINGQVSDQTGAILPGANVTVTNTVSGRALMTLTIDDGSYHARALEPGRYNVKFEFAGFSPVEVP